MLSRTAIKFIVTIGMQKLTDIKINGEYLSKLPGDLYIPPDALSIMLETFEGPLDLLLYLIKKQNINILDIPVAEVSKQYLEYIEIIRQSSLELAAEYLVMAAFLTEIKSKILLPQSPSPDLVEEVDPRQELVHKLEAYQQFKQAAQVLENLKQHGRDFFLASASISNLALIQDTPEIHLDQLIRAFDTAMRRSEMLQITHTIHKDTISINQCMTSILRALHTNSEIDFTNLINPDEGKLGVVVNFLALLELLKNKSVILTQARSFAKIIITKFVT